MSKPTKPTIGFCINKEMNSFILEYVSDDQVPLDHEEIIKIICDWALYFRQNHESMIQEALLANEMSMDFDEYDAQTKH